MMSIGNLIFAFFLGAVVLAITFIQFPGVFEHILNYAAVVKSSLISMVPFSEDTKQYKNFMRFIVEETQLVFMFFVIVARIILSLIMWGVSSLVSR